MSDALAVVSPPMPYFQEGDIRLYCGDNREVLPTLVGEPVDLIFTSPPYNIGNTTGGGFPDRFGHYRKSSGLAARGGGSAGAALAAGYDGYDDNMPHDEYVRWQNSFLLQCWELLSEKGAIYYNHKPRILNGELIAPVDYIPAELKKYIRQEIIWKRSGGINFSTAFYLPTHERIVVIAKRNFRLKSKGASGVGDVWSIKQETDSDHPAPFPIELPLRAIETVAPLLVLDPFCGRGATLRAAKRMGCAAIGIDQSKLFCDMAVGELRDETQMLLPLPPVGGAEDEQSPLFPFSCEKEEVRG